MKKTEELIIFNARFPKVRRSFNIILISVLIPVSLLLITSTGVEFRHSGMLIVTFAIFFVVVAIAEAAFYFFNLPKTSFKEITYSGSLDELVRELSGFEIEPKMQVGKTNVFTITSLFLPRRGLFVKDMGASCELYGLYLDEIWKMRHYATNSAKSNNNFKVAEK
jgi:hypothetical protein